MKKKFMKLNTGLIVFLFLLYSFVPFCSLIASLAGYELILNNSVMWAAVTLGVGAVVTVLMFIFTGKTVHISGAVLAGLSLWLTEINWILYGFIDTKAMFIVALTFIFGFMIWLRFAKPVILKTVVVIVAVIMLPILSIFSFVSLAYSEDTAAVVQSLKSPDGRLYAEVVNVNKADGAKYTNVDVYVKDAGLDLGVFEFSKKPENVYTSDSEEFENIEAVWKNNGVLSVNGEEYTVQKK